MLAVTVILIIIIIVVITSLPTVLLGRKPRLSEVTFLRPQQHWIPSPAHRPKPVFFAPVSSKEPRAQSLLELNEKIEVQSVESHDERGQDPLSLLWAEA